MRLLPIVERELRVAARRRGTFWLRAGFGSAAIVIGGFIYLANLDSSARQFAEILFGFLAFISMFYCLLAGVRSTADCLSSEKREGTLGLLFLTDLKGYDVVFGKLAATSISGFYGLLAIFPILAVPLLLGGLSPGDFWRAVLVLINAFFFSLAIGVFVSAASKSARKAMAATFGIVFLFTAIFPACAGLILLLTPSHRSQFARALLWPCSIYSMVMSEDSEYGKAAWRFWCSVGMTQGLTWIFLLLASWLAPRSWQDKPRGAAWRLWQERWRGWVYGNEVQRKDFRRRLLDINPFYWLAGRVRVKPVQAWIFLGLAACFWGWGCAKAGSEWFNEGIYFPTAIFLNSVFKLWIASVAGRQLSEDRKAGALELLLTTPLGVQQILRGQFLALARQFLGPLAIVVGAELIFLAASLQRESFGANPLNPTVWIAGVIMLVADLTALAWVAMWTALTAKTPNRLIGITVVRILVAPWLLYIALAIVVGLGLPPLKWTFHVGSWFGLGMLTDVAFGLVAWRQLRTHFRELAREPFAPVSSRFAKLFRRRRLRGKIQSRMS